MGDFDLTPTELAEELDALVRQEVLRGWRYENERYLIEWWDNIDVDDATQMVELDIRGTSMTLPQARAFRAGCVAGLSWVGVVARRVRTEANG